MIYFITFIFTLLLTHIARAVPACGDVTFPEDMYEPTCDNEQLVLAIYNATMNTKYDNMNGITNSLACSHLATLYPRFMNIPTSHILAAHLTSKGIILPTAASAGG